MASSGKFGSLAAPVFLRMAVGVTFVWAGLGKLLPDIEVKGGDAAIIANLGVGLTPAKNGSSPPATVPDADAPAKPVPPAVLPLPADKPASPSGPGVPLKPKPDPKPPGKAPSRSTGPTRPVPSEDDQFTSVTGFAGYQPLRQTAAQPRNDAPASSAPPAGGTNPPSSSAPAHAAPAGALPPGGRYAAADFPNPVKVRRVYSLAALIVKSAFGPGTPLWPKALASDPWAVYCAFGAAFTELVCGVLVLAGIFTRPAAAMLGGVMITAIWLTQVGPAVAGGQTILGILPDRPWFDPAAWKDLLWQFCLLCSCLALACCGAGGLSIDRVFAGRGGGDEAEKKPAKG